MRMLRSVIFYFLYTFVLLDSSRLVELLRYKATQADADEGHNTGKDHWRRAAFRFSQLQDGNQMLAGATNVRDDDAARKQLETQHWLELIDGYAFRVSLGNDFELKRYMLAVVDCLANIVMGQTVEWNSFVLLEVLLMIRSAVKVRWQILIPVGHGCWAERHTSFIINDGSRRTRRITSSNGG